MPDIKHILDCFPAHFYAADPEKRLYHVLAALNDKLSEDENSMARVLRSHWINTLQEITDLKLVAALFSDLGEPYDDGVQKGRLRLEKIIQLFLNGPGTVRSIFEFAGLELARLDLLYERNATGDIVLRDENGSILFEQVDNHSFISRAKLEREVGTKEGEEIEVYQVELEENPNLDSNYHQPETFNRAPFFLNNNGFFTQYPTITVIGIDKRTVNFRLVNSSTGEAIGYRGRVGNGKILVITPGQDGLVGEAKLEGNDVSHFVYSIAGAQFEEDTYDAEDAVFGIRLPKDTYSVARSAGTGEDGAEYSQPPREVDMPGIPVGESQWHFHVMPARFDDARFNRFVYHIPDEVKDKYDAANFNGAVFALEPSADIQLDWQERERTSFRLKLPPGAFAAEDREKVLEKTQKIVRRVKAAGVKAEVLFNEE
ncbi:MAG: hypothetical protein GY765_21580 [bacterium]|nr:hypothetical protein [bacterium]